MKGLRPQLLGEAAAVVLGLAVAVGGIRWLADPVYRIDGLVGPPVQPAVAASAPAPTDPAIHAPAQAQAQTKGRRSQLAIYLTDPASPWLGLAFGLRSIGIPFVVTSDVRQAVQHALVLVYPTISGRRIGTASSDTLRAHVQAGGTLIGFEILGAGLDDVFGLGASSAGTSRRALAWTDAAADAYGFSEPEERSVPLADATTPMNSYALRPAGAQVLARFDDGTPALTRHGFGTGRAYAFGLDLGAFMASAQQGRKQAWREYVNAYEPGVDVLLRWLKAVYREAEPAAVTLGTVPQGRPLAIVLSHDVDYNQSMRNALDYARSEARQNVGSTFFIQTKYVRDWNDQVFFDAEGMAMARELHQLGGELASHSVAHSPVFSQLPAGTGLERYPDYAPFVESKDRTRGASVLGELRVSRFLLEHAVPGLHIESFRPGHLENPFSLPQALEATKYRYSSALSSGMAMSHLPFRLSHNRDGRTATAIFEFPITLEDELVRPMDTLLLPRALEVARKLSAYGGVCTVLIHPNVLDDKLRFQERFVARMQQRGAWIGPLGAFAGWWVARDGVDVDVEAYGGRLRVRLRASQPIAALPLQLPAGWRPAAETALTIVAGAHGLSLDLPEGETVLNLVPGDASMRR